MSQKIELGDRVRHVIHGFEGIVEGYHCWLTGCDSVTIRPTDLNKDGQPHDDLAPQAAEYLKGTDLTVGVDLGAGTSSSTVWTCDLSAEYVRINADYRT